MVVVVVLVVEGRNGIVVVIVRAVVVVGIEVKILTAAVLYYPFPLYTDTK